MIEGSMIASCPLLYMFFVTDARNDKPQVRMALWSGPMLQEQELATSTSSVPQQHQQIALLEAI